MKISMIDITWIIAANFAADEISTWTSSLQASLLKSISISFEILNTIARALQSQLQFIFHCISVMPRHVFILFQEDKGDEKHNGKIGLFDTRNDLMRLRLQWRQAAKSIVQHLLFDTLRTFERKIYSPFRHLWLFNTWWKANSYKKQFYMSVHSLWYCSLLYDVEFWIVIKTSSPEIIVQIVFKWCSKGSQNLLEIQSSKKPSTIWSTAPPCRLWF